MPFFDLRTVIVLTGLMSGLMALVVFSLQRSYPKNILGLREWSMALTALFLGGFLTALRGIAPDALGLTLSNFLLTYGLLLAYQGTQRFFNATQNPRPWWVAIGLVTLAMVWFTYFRPNYMVRLVLANLLISAQFAFHAVLLLRHSQRTFAQSLLFAVLASMSFIPLMRAVTALFYPVGENVLVNSPFQTLYVTSFAVAVLLFSISVVLMANDQLRGELEHLATHDSLTNALNRRQMNQLCQQELDRCKRTGRCMALLIMDLDNFKAVNDSYGHQAGDRVLVDFVSRASLLLRMPDRLGRFGGEEFIALLPETSLADAMAVAHRIRAACHTSEVQPQCTVSIGVTVNLLPPGCAEDDVNSLVARADSAMYRAKQNGRDRVEWA